MKKILALTLVLLCVAGCGASATTLGLGLISDISVTDATDSADGSVQATVSAVSAVFDADGKIVNVWIDAVQPSATVSADGAITASDDLRTKVEKGADYGMATYSPIGKEMYEQYAALEDYMIGKTVTEVLSMPLSQGVADVEDLKTSCTIHISDYLAALEKAWNNKK